MTGPQRDRNNLVREAFASNQLTAVIALYFAQMSPVELKKYNFHACNICHQPKKENQFCNDLKIGTSPNN